MSPFVRPRVLADPAVRVFGFHHAGGSAAMYHPIGRELPADWELCLLDLPGRGKRHAERPLERLDEVVARAVADLEPWLGSPFVLVGHSFGALVALEAGRVLDGLGRPPLWVGVSGRVPPGCRPGTRLSQLDDEELLRAMVAMGGMPDRLNEVPAFVERFLRVTRADLRAVESYAPDPGRVPLSCPLTVFTGTDDLWAPLPALAGWAEESVRGCRRRVFPGGHFYFAGPAMKDFARALVEEVQAVVPLPEG